MRLTRRKYKVIKATCESAGAEKDASARENMAL